MNQPTAYPRLRTIIQDEPLLIMALLIIGLLRMGAIIITPLEFGVDEAQYWLWGQHLDFGYYSKPPLIGWYLGLMDALFGSSTIAARITAPLLHIAIALVLYAIASAHHSAAAGRWAALFWASLPIVSLGSFVISTDSLLLVPWVFALALFLQAQKSDNAKHYFYTGLIIGIGFLAKYAAIYFLAGTALVLFIASSGRLRERITAFLLIVGGALITASPNLIWNIFNGGVTIAHLGENADLERPHYSLASAFEFLLSQSAVIGPISLILICVALLRFSKLSHRAFAKQLLCFSLPVVIIMTIQAYLKTANANWAATAWPTACLLLGCLLAQTEPRLISRFWGRLALSVNLFAALFLIAAIGAGSLGQWTPQSDPLRRLRGWDQLATDVRHIAEAQNITIIIADRRAEAALLSWHLHDSTLAVKVFDEDGIIGSHFELTSALSQDDAPPFLLMTGADGKLPDAFRDKAVAIGDSLVPIAANRTRHKRFFIVQSPL